MIPRTALFWLVLALTFLPLIAGLALVPSMPAMVPTHFGINDQPDGYSSRVAFVIGQGVVIATIGILLLVIPLIGPMRKSYEQFRVVYGRICAVMMVSFNAIALILLLKATGANVPIGSSMMLILGLMLAVVANWLGKVRRNFWVGIRTPWTLANDVVWERTHRVGGRILFLYGLLIAATGVFTPGAIAIGVIVAGAVFLCAWSLIYSAVLYHHLGSVDHMT